MDLLPALEHLTERERVLVEMRLGGASYAKCAAAAGMPLGEVIELFKTKHIEGAMKYGKAITAAATLVTRETVSEMLIEAYRTASCATEMVLAARELAKLHGLNAPTQVSIDHTHRLMEVKTERELRLLSIAELERIAQLRPNDVLEGEFVDVPRIAHAQEA